MNELLAILFSGLGTLILSKIVIVIYNRITHRIQIYEKNVIRTIGNRTFGLYFNNGYQIWPVKLHEYIKLVGKESKSKSDELYFTMFKLIEAFKNDTDLKNIDAELLTKSRRFPKQILSKMTGTLPSQELSTYKGRQKAIHLGNYPKKGIHPNFIQSWIEMREICKKLLCEYHQSPYRIVLSYFFNGKMTITSRKTSKLNLIPYLNTPIVTGLESLPGKYYGFEDEENSPSTETPTHWVIHNELIHKYDDESSAIIHCHPQNLLTLLGSENRPLSMFNENSILDYEVSGTIELGSNLSKVLETNRYAILKDHGVWTIGNNFGDAYNNLLNLLILADACSNYK